MKFILFLVLILTIFNIAKSATITFNNTIDCSKSCQWSTPTNWIGGVLPKAGDDVVINIGSKSTVQVSDLSSIEYKSVSVVNSILNLVSTSSSSGIVKNIKLSNDSKFIVTTNTVTIQDVTGKGLIILEPSSETSMTIDNVQVDGLYINGGTSATITSSTIGFVSQYDQSQFFGGSSPKQVTFSNTNSIGAIYILSNSLSFTDSFTLDGTLISSTYKSLINNVMGSNSSSAEDTITFKTSTLTMKSISNLKSYPILAVDSSTTTFSISNCKLDSSLQSSAKSVVFDGTISFLSNSSVVSFTNDITFKSTFSQLNAENSLSIKSAQVTIGQVNPTQPLIIAKSIDISGSATLVFANEPSEMEVFIIFKSIGLLNGEFSPITVKIVDDIVDSKEYITSFSNNVFSLTYSDQISNASILTVSFILISLLSLILLL